MAHERIESRHARQIFSCEVHGGTANLNFGTADLNSGTANLNFGTANLNFARLI